MYGGDEPSTPSPPIRSQQQQQREVYVGDELPPRSNSTRKKSKEPAPIIAPPPPVVAAKAQHSPPASSVEHVRNLSVTGDDIEAAFDAINDYKSSMHESMNNRAKDQDLSSPDSLFGLSTIKEAGDTDELFGGKDSAASARNRNEAEFDELDFDQCFDKYKPKVNQTKPPEEKTSKAPAPAKPTVPPPQANPEPKSARQTKEPKRSAPVHTEPARASSVTIATPKIETTPTPTISSPKTIESISSRQDDSNDSIDEDVDELLGKLEVSIRGCPSYTHTHTHTYIHT